MITFIFDTETTGLIENHLLPLEKQPEIIEFYGVMVDLSSGEIFDELEWLLCPRTPVPPEQEKYTPITQEMVKDGPAFATVEERIRLALANVDAVLAHNLAFDMEMVGIEYERLGQAIEWPRRRICTVEQTVHLKGFRLSLTALHEHLFGEAFDEAHRAKADTQALMRCALKLYQEGEL